MSRFRYPWGSLHQNLVWIAKWWDPSCQILRIWMVGGSENLWVMDLSMFIKKYTVYKMNRKEIHTPKIFFGMPTSRKTTLDNFRSNFLWSWWCHVVGSFEAFGHTLHFRRQTPTWVSSIPFPHLCLHTEPPSQSRLGLRGKSCHGKPPASDFPGRLCRLTWTFKNSKVLFFEWKSKPKN